MGEYDRAISFGFSPDAKRFILVVRNDNKELVVVDGKEGKYYDHVGGFMFSRDSQHYMYNAWNNEKGIIVKDDSRNRRIEQFRICYFYSRF